MSQKNDNIEFTNITDLLRQTAETVQSGGAAAKKEETEENKINDIFTDFNFDDGLGGDSDDVVFEDIIPFEEAVLLQQKKQEVPRWVIITGITLSTIILLVITYLFGLRLILYNVYFDKALKYLNNNEIEKVSVALQTALFFKGDLEQTYTTFSKECWQIGKYNEALYYLNEVQKKNEHNFKMLNLFAKVYISKEEFDKANYYIDKMDKYYGLTSESLYNRGEISNLKGDLQKAVDYFEQALMRNSEDPAAYIKLRRLYLKLAQFDKALKIQSQLQSLKDAPALDAEAFAAYGQIYISKKEYDKAERFYTMSIEKNPKQPELYLQLAKIYKYQSIQNPNRIDKVMENYKKYLELKPDDALVLSDLGYMYYKKNDIKNAVLLLEQSMKLDPKIPETHYYIAKLFTYIFKQYNQAIKEYENAIQLGYAPDELKFHYSFAAYYNNNYEKALELLKSLMNSTSLKNQPLITDNKSDQSENKTNNLLVDYSIDSGILLYNLANILVLNNNYKEAIVTYNNILSANLYTDENEKIKLLNNMALSFELANQPDSAYNYYWKAIEEQERLLDKQNSDFIVNTTDKPRKNFKRMLSIRPKITDLKENMEWELKTTEIIK